MLSESQNTLASQAWVEGNPPGLDVTSLADSKLSKICAKSKQEIQFRSVQFSRSVVSDSLWPHGLHAVCQASPSITNSWSLPKLMSVESVMPSSHLILWRPLLLPPSIFPSIRVFSNESALCIKWPKYWSFSFNISPSNDYSGLISFRMDWLGLLKISL